MGIYATGSSGLVELGPVVRLQVPMYALDLQQKDWRLMSPKKKLTMTNLPDSVDGFTVTDPDEMMDKYLLKYSYRRIKESVTDRLAER
ncbi:hypothetical protein DPMN_084934 [Dreissena polymorpha]|uniref:Uncharacterized protein n=1 Tax=Dreissena polymorpha TaxID=45954 RepID=A0A9D4BLD1_DREPO|nr:hypothetical protein DPMN_084934 [Dreissena polymorpha]